MEKMIEFVNLSEIKKRKAHYNLLFGTRSDGKTYAVLFDAWKRFLSDGSKLALIRRWDEDFVGSNSARNCYNSLMHNAFGKNVIEEESGGEYNGVEFYAGKYYLTIPTEDGKTVRSSKFIAYGLSINSSEHYKSASFPDVGTVLFDEFIATKTTSQQPFCNISTSQKATEHKKKEVANNYVSNLLSVFTPVSNYMISKAISIILVNEVWRCSAEQASPVTSESEMVQMQSASLPLRAAFI